MDENSLILSDYFNETVRIEKLFERIDSSGTTAEKEIFVLNALERFKDVPSFAAIFEKWLTEQFEPFLLYNKGETKSLQYAGFNSVVGFQVTSPYMTRSSSSLNDQLETSKLEIKQKNRITPSTSCSKIENPIIFDSPSSKSSRTLTEDLLLNSEHIRARFFNMTP